MAEKKKVGVLLSENKLRKKYPSSQVASVKALHDGEMIRIPTRVIAMNHQMGGGLPYGHIMELYGEENVGKTLLAMDMAVVTQKLGGVVLWADIESTFNPDWCIQNGLDLDKIELFSEKNAIEEAADWFADFIPFYRNKLKNNEPILLVIDSLAATDTTKNEDVSEVDAKAEMGNRAKAVDAVLRRRNKLLHRYGVATIFINQMRSKIGASQFEDPDTTPCGKAMKFYASIRIGLYRGRELKEGKGTKAVKVGRLVYSRLKKTKVAMPQGNIKAEVYFKETGGKLGYSKYYGLVDVLTDNGIVERRRGAHYYFKDKKIAHGDDKMESIFTSKPKLRKKLISALNVNTISKTRKLIKSKAFNMYPVGKPKKSEDDE